MLQLLRNLSINVVMSSVLVCFAFFIAVVAALGVMASREADDSLQMLRQVNEQQLNEINRADALLNGARINLEITLNYIMMGRMVDSAEDVAVVEEMLDRAEQHLSNFIAAPKSETAERLAGPLVDNFHEMFQLTHELGTAVIQLNTPSFTRLREQMVEPSQALRESTSAFVEYANERAASQLVHYEAQNTRFAWIGAVVLAFTAIILMSLYLVLRKIIIEPLGTAVDSLERISEADLSGEVQVLGRNEISQLFAAMAKMQQSLTRIVGDVRQGGSSIHIGTQQIASGNADLSSRTEQQAASLEETATSMEELSATVRQNADNARQASGLALDASTTATRGGEVVDQVITTMQGISGCSQKISDIIGVIDSIAFQTNILALNASVEAARAGDQGRGFAVVAGEVRNLAGRSAEAAREIKELIEGSVVQVKDGSVLVEQAGQTMQEVVAAVRRVTDIMDEISAASQEQSEGIEQVSQAVSQMDEVTQQNAALVQQAAAAAVSLEEQADRLERAMTVFRLPGESSAALPALVTETESTEQRSPARLARSGMATTNMTPTSMAPGRPVTTSQRTRRDMVVEDDWEEF